MVRHHSSAPKIPRSSKFSRFSTHVSQKWCDGGGVVEFEACMKIFSSKVDVINQFPFPSKKQFSFSVNDNVYSSCKDGTLHLIRDESISAFCPESWNLSVRSQSSTDHYFTYPAENSNLDDEPLPMNMEAFKA